jgi:transposase-like protein
MFKGYNIKEFIKQFSDEQSCHNYLKELKWSAGFICKKCKHKTSCKTSKPNTVKCTKCKTKESTTSGTLFHKIKFDLTDAFMIVFLVATDKKGASSLELNRRIGLRAKTCYYFKRKVMKSMHSQGTIKLTGQIEVDESFVGGMEEGKRGRSKGKKKEFVMAVQIKNNNITGIKAMQVKNCSAKELKPFFEKYIDKDSNIKTDQWRSYGVIKKDFTKLEQEKSNPKINFKLFHREAMMLKSALRGIYHHVTHLQDYLDEYTYRKNNCKSQNIFHNVINRMIKHKPVFIANLNSWGN